LRELQIFASLQFVIRNTQVCENKPHTLSKTVHACLLPYGGMRTFLVFTSFFLIIFFFILSYLLRRYCHLRIRTFCVVKKI